MPTHFVNFFNTKIRTIYAGLAFIIIYINNLLKRA